MSITFPNYSSLYNYTISLFPFCYSIIFNSQSVEKAMGKMALDPDELYPERLDEPDCAYYMTTSLCGDGSNYRFNHPLHVKQVVIQLPINFNSMLLFLLYQGFMNWSWIWGFWNRLIPVKENSLRELDNWNAKYGAW